MERQLDFRIDFDARVVHVKLENGLVPPPVIVVPFGAWKTVCATIITQESVREGQALIRSPAETPPGSRLL